MRIAIVGSRTFDDYEFLKDVLSHYHPSTIISGGAKGADLLAKRYANENDIPLIEFLPDWDTHGKAAGPIRNKQIVAEADEVIAFWDGVSRGTKSTVGFAKQVGKPVHVFWKTA